MHVLDAKLRSCVLTTTFGFTGWCTTLVERFLCRFEEINLFTSLNTANINVEAISECIPCMILRSNIQLHKHVLMHLLYAKPSLCAYCYFQFRGLMYNTCRPILYRFEEINIFKSLNTAYINVGNTTAMQSMHGFSSIQLHKHVLMHILVAKASLCAYFNFSFIGWCTTLV